MSTFSTLISAADLHAGIQSNPDDGSLVVIDCRFSLADTNLGEQKYQTSRIPHARYAHLDRDLSSEIVPGITGRHPLPDADDLSAQFTRWGINNSSQIVAYDDKSGAIASRFWWLSRWLGHENCAVLNGGFAAWQAAGFTLETETPTATPSGNFTRQAALTGVVEKQDVLDANHCLVDAREAERYRGEHEPIDKVAGHIPGALNAPFMDNVNADGTFKDIAALQKRFDFIRSKAEDKKIVHYCGSGVTAAHNMLAMAVAERDPGLLYAGSFSEWISRSDEQFPVATLVD